MLKTKRDLFKNSNILTLLKNIQPIVTIVTNKKCKNGYTTRIITICTEQ